MLTDVGMHMKLNRYLTVGTPGLGYPLLLCLGEKSFVVILNYVQRPDPCGPEALFAQQWSRTRPLVGKTDILNKHALTCFVDYSYVCLVYISHKFTYFSNGVACGIHICREIFRVTTARWRSAPAYSQ